HRVVTCTCLAMVVGCSQSPPPEPLDSKASDMKTEKLPKSDNIEDRREYPDGNYPSWYTGPASLPDQAGLNHLRRMNNGSQGSPPSPPGGGVNSDGSGGASSGGGAQGGGSGGQQGGYGDSNRNGDSYGGYGANNGAGYGGDNYAGYGGND